MTQPRPRRGDAVLVLSAPLILLAGFAYHPLLEGPDDYTGVAHHMAADPVRWFVAHMIAAVGAGLVLLAFLAIHSFARAQGGGTWTRRSVLPLGLATTLFIMLPAMELGVFAASRSGADGAAAQAELSTWLVPTYALSSALFLAGVAMVAWEVRGKGYLSNAARQITIAGLALAALIRFVPVGWQFIVGGVLLTIALWPLGIAIWRSGPDQPDTTRATG